MNFVFVPRDLSRFVLTYCANEYFKLEQDGIGAQTVVCCRDMQDVIKYIERGPDLDHRDSIDIVGVIPSAADLDVLRSMVDSTTINVILGENQITPDIEKDESLVDRLDVPLLERAWNFYMSNEIPAFIKKMDLALSNNGSADTEIAVLQDATAKLATIKIDVAMDHIQQALETDGASLIEFTKGSV